MVVEVHSSHMVFYCQGSGKTLAFSIPIIHHILHDRGSVQNNTALAGDVGLDLEPSDDDELLSSAKGQRRSCEESNGRSLCNNPVSFVVLSSKNTHISTQQY